MLISLLNCRNFLCRWFTSWEYQHLHSSMNWMRLNRGRTSERLSIENKLLLLDGLNARAANVRFIFFERHRQRQWFDWNAALNVTSENLFIVCIRKQLRSNYMHRNKTMKYYDTSDVFIGMWNISRRQSHTTGNIFSLTQFPVRQEWYVDVASVVCARNLWWSNTLERVPHSAITIFIIRLCV